VNAAPTPVLLSWSGGKDCLLALAALRNDPKWRVVGLLTTLTRTFDRVSMHGIRRDVLHAQVAAIGLPLIECKVDWPSSNAAYEAAHAAALRQASERWSGLCHCGYGDLFLADVRAYRERQLDRAGWRAVFPVWGEDTGTLARRFCAQGHRAVLTCVDTQQLDAAFSGRRYDPALLKQLPTGVDPCGERGEFHTLSYAGPLFARPLQLDRGPSTLRDGRFQYTDFTLSSPATGGTDQRHGV
jgi:uncharacterized protein (TIGR00290 family)